MPRSTTWIMAALSTLLPAMSAGGASLGMGGIAIDTTADGVDIAPGDGSCRTAAGTCSLRAAIMEANASPASGSVLFVPPGHYLLTIAPDGGDDAASGDLDVTGAYGLYGAGPDVTVIDANHLDRAIEFASTASSVLDNLTVSDGTTPLDGGCIRNVGALSLHRVRVTGCDSGARGGAIVNGATLSMQGTTLDLSHAALAGGGLYDDGQSSISQSTIDRNSADSGGGIVATGSTVIVASTISRNTASTIAGGLLSAESETAVVNSTIAANRAGTYGGGVGFAVSAVRPANLYNVTIALNVADADANGEGSGGGVAVLGTPTSSTDALNLYNSLLASNYHADTPAADDCAGTILNHARNVIGSTDGCTVTLVSGGYTLLNSTDTLSGLFVHGGPTETIALRADSNAIDAGSPDGCLQFASLPITDDQRGYTRPVGAACDVGAYESGATNPEDPIFADGFDAP